jgi:hypothetical protein
VSRYSLEPRAQKVHLYHDQEGATYRGGVLFCDTLCKGNWNRQTTLTTTDPNKVTCQICRKDARFKAMVDPLLPNERLYGSAKVETSYVEPEGAAGPVAAPAPTVSALRTRHRVGWRGKLILQVCENYPINSLGHKADHWRDATLADLDLGVV